MELEINNQQSIAEVKQQFTQLFPYLKLEFFYKRHKPGRPSNFKYLAKDEIKLSDFEISSNSDKIVITPKMSVNELEQSFGDRYGLGVQVFRKSGKVWLETIYTDVWTLAEQNSEGESLSKPLPPDELIL
jgi:hypothetical protein